MMKEFRTDEASVKKAIHAAVAAIYFADNSDYYSYLWDVVKALSPKAAKLLDEDNDTQDEAYEMVKEW